MSTNTLFDYEVQDSAGEKVGKVENVWEYGGEAVGYIGISTGWLGLGQTHVVPGKNAVIDHQAQTVKVPYGEETIKASPSYAFSEDLSEAEEKRLTAHYGVASGITATPAASDDFPAPDYPAASASGANVPASAVTDHDEIEVPLAEEKLHVSKREVSQGEVRLRKVVRTEIVNQPVELRHEEVIVERVSGGTSQPGGEAFVEKVISIPVSEEEAVVSKTVQSAGAVKATKVAESEEKTISETLRKEDVEVERDVLTEKR